MHIAVVTRASVRSGGLVWPVSQPTLCNGDSQGMMPRVSQRDHIASEIILSAEMSCSLEVLVSRGICVAPPAHHVPGQKRHLGRGIHRAGRRAILHELAGTKRHQAQWAKSRAWGRRR